MLLQWLQRLRESLTRSIAYSVAEANKSQSWQTFSDFPCHRGSRPNLLKHKHSLLSNRLPMVLLRAASAATPSGMSSYVLVSVQNTQPRKVVLVLETAPSGLQIRRATSRFVSHVDRW